MSEARRMGGIMLVLALASCAIGEVPPEGPSTPSDAESPAAPGELPGSPGAAEGDADRMAGEVVGRAAEAYEAGLVEEALDLAQQAIAFGGTSARPAALWVAARSAFATGRYGAAEELATAYARSQPRGSETRAEGEALAELARDAGEADRAAAVIGAILPRTGSRYLVHYGDLLLEGIELAVARAEQDQGRRIELVVADDGGGARTAQALRELERRGAVAVVGPLLPEQLAEAARVRSDPSLVLVSPTVTEAPSWPRLYSVSGSDDRGAAALGVYAAEAGLREAAVLHLGRPEYRRKAEAFRRAFEARGGRVRVTVPYDSGTTTFGPHLERVMAGVGRAREAGAGVLGEPARPDTPIATDQPFALFVAAPERDVPQVAPQISFYGLDAAGARVFGDEAWAWRSVRRVVPSRDLEGVIASSYFPPDRSEGVSDPEFVRLYENRYRKSLTSPVPALGYDAANLLLQALPNRRLSPGSVARRFDLLAGIRGATGLLSVREDRIVRMPYLVEIRDGVLVTARGPWDGPAGSEAAGDGRVTGAARSPR